MSDINSIRYTLIDWLRCFAIVLMIVYHFLWDLKEVQLISAEFFNSFPVRLVGRTCLMTFLFCVGYSLAIAHREQINWRPFWRRWAKIAIAALCVSIGTYIAFPSRFVYFGILHHIAFVSVALLLFLRIKTFALLLGLYIVLPYWLEPLGLCFDDVKMIYPWLGNHCRYPTLFLHRPTLDYIDLIPWGGCSLIGLGISQFDLHKRILLPRVGAVEWLSRQSFWIYIIHQPILLGLAFGLAKIL